MASQPSSSSLTPRSTLMDLPADIHHMIMAQLKPHGPLFLPDYKLAQKVTLLPLLERVQHYYGERTEDDDQCARGLLNLSVTCHYFHKLIAPRLYDTVVLYCTPEGIESVLALSRSSHWSQVRSLIIVASDAYDIDDQDEDNWEGDTEEEIDAGLEAKRAELMRSGLRDLDGILSHLPPDLESLTLDYAQPWDNGNAFGWLEDVEVDSDDEEGSEDYLDSVPDAIVPYMFQIKAIITYISRYDISSKSTFEFRMHNVPPFQTSAYRMPAFHKFLSFVTSFTFSVCAWDSGSELGMDTLAATDAFARKSSVWFFNHLDRVTQFDFDSDASWPFELVQDDNQFDLGLASE